MLTTLKKALMQTIRDKPVFRIITQTTIDYYIIQEQEAGLERQIEPIRKPLISRQTLNTNKKLSIIGLDSSNSIIRTPFINIVILSSSASSASLPEIYDHPEIYSYPVAPMIKPPYIVLATNNEVELEGEGITTTNPLGTKYTYNYPPDRIADEYRAWLENWMLSDPILSFIEKARNDPPVVMVDGPLYYTPQLVAKIGGNLSEPSSLWRSIVENRVKAINALERKGVPVIGVVKRIEHSRLLVGSDVYMKLVKGKCGLGINDYNSPNDQALLHILLQVSKCRQEPFLYMRTPTISHYSPEYDIEKYFNYIVIPPGRWSRLTHTYRMYRIEYTEKTMKLLDDYNLKPWDILLLESIAKGIQEPFSIKLSDRRSGMIAQVLRNKIRKLVNQLRIPYTYDELNNW